MPMNLSAENNFIGGLKTEFTGLNFPENACTSVDNCVFSLIGDVLRREGINYEVNNTLNSIDLTNAGAGAAISTFHWDNAGGDGQSKVFVLQVGSSLYFFYTSLSTATSPLSAQLLTPVVNLGTFLASGSSANPSLLECQYAAGNGYLFVFHPNCDPFYCVFSLAGSHPAIIPALITLQTRDFAGIFPEPGNPAVSFRPTTLSPEHQYNLTNQGWTDGATWSTSANGSPASVDIMETGNVISMATGINFTFSVASGLTIANGTAVNITWSVPYAFNSPGDGTFFTTANGTANGSVTGYTGNSLTINMIASSNVGISPGSFVNFTGNGSVQIQASNLINTISTWFTQIGNYPSNADIWFEYKDAGTITGENGIPTFNPADTIAQVSFGFGQAPQGHFVLTEFNQNRSMVSGLSGLTSVVTTARPKTGAFYAGRVWYSGVDGSQTATGDEPYYTWTEKVYFSQIITDATDFGNCYQVNDPTDENLNNLLPSDGGSIFIQGSGSIYKLFPVQNGILVFAANGVWFITGGTGLGFTADDYTITKISAVQSISGTSFVDVLGLPFFWNAEGIYRVISSQGDQTYKYGGFNVEPLTIGTILTFYNSIPFDSRRYARGDYDAINYTISWVYRSTEESGLSNRYKFDSSLNLNIYNRAFYPYTFGNNSHDFVYGINYITYTTGSLVPQFKYLIGPGTQQTFGEENDANTWLDFNSSSAGGVNYTSSFTTGYKVHGQAYRLFQPIYVNMYVNDSIPNSYSIQGIWDFATTNLGRTSTVQVVTNPHTVTYQSGLVQAPQGGYGFTYRRHKIRGHGQALQISVSSIQGSPFHFIGWSIPEQINVGS